MFQVDLSGKTVLITGANAGIGLGIAGQMAIAGANLAGIDLDADGVGFKSEMSKQNSNFLYSRADVTQQEDQQRIVQETVAAFGGIDIFVSNAGTNIFTGADGNEKDWQENIQLNLTSHWQLAKYSKPYLQKNQGVIIIITSNHAYHSIPGCFPYNVAKNALTSIVQSLAIEWGPAIRTVGIAPGFIDTEGNQKWFNSFANPEKEKQDTIELHPVKKLGTPAEIGGWCVFLASSYAAFASGTTYLVDGGRSALMQ